MADFEYCNSYKLVEDVSTQLQEGKLDEARKLSDTCMVSRAIKMATDAQPDNETKNQVRAMWTAPQLLPQVEFEFDNQVKHKMKLPRDAKTRLFEN